MSNLREWFDDNIAISEEWLNEVGDYELKILLLTSVLAQNNLAYRGTLKIMCEWLGIQSCTVNNKAIKQALDNLSDKGYIFFKKEGRTYHISISNKGMKDKRIYKVRKKWIEAFKRYNKDNNGKVIDKSLSVDWIKILRIFIYIYYLKPHEIVTLESLAKITDTSIETVRKALIAILDCDLRGIHVEKEIVKENYEDENGNICWRTKGQIISVFVKFNELN